MEMKVCASLPLPGATPSEDVYRFVLTSYFTYHRLQSVGRDGTAGWSAKAMAQSADSTPTARPIATRSAVARAADSTPPSNASGE